MPEVRDERIHWRDLRLNDWHRRWGWNCPAVDIDCLFLEYDEGQPIALVEYKHESAPPQFASHPSYQALIRLADRPKIPVFAVRYSDDFLNWLAIPLNAEAKTRLPIRQLMVEKEFVALLYRLRGRELPADLFDASSEPI